MAQVKIFVAFRSAPRHCYTLTFDQGGSAVLLSDIELAVRESRWMGTMRPDTYRIEYTLHHANGTDTPLVGETWVPAYSTLYLRRLPSQKPAAMLEPQPTPISYSERVAAASTGVKT